MDYYSLFWGPGVMSTSNEPCGAFTCRSSTLVVLADSGPFHGLLLTVLGSRIDFIVVEPKVRLRVGRQHSRFCSILAHFMDYYSLFWGLAVTSTLNKPCGAFTCRSSTLTYLADSCPFRALLLSVLETQRDLHD